MQACSNGQFRIWEVGGGGGGGHKVWQGSNPLQLCGNAVSSPIR